MEELLSGGFTAYVGLALLLYVIREAEFVPNRYINVVAVVLGLGFSILEARGFNFEVFLSGLQYALLGIGSVAGVKYAVEKHENGGDVS